MTSTLPSPQGAKRKHVRLIETTYKTNVDSDYTEKIEELNKSFDYKANSHVYWSEPEQSLLYGTPLYQQASASQKMALNHLHWFGKYNYTAETETETVFFNQLTSGVFEAVGGYQTLCDELALETHQEHSHIHAFRRMGLMIALNLIGKKPLQNLQKSSSYKHVLQKDKWTLSQYQILKLLAKNRLNSSKQFYSNYLKELEQKPDFIISAPTKGVLGRGVPESWQSFFIFNWGGGSPFLACQYYTGRMMGNILLQSMEHNVSKHFQKLEKEGEFIPTPTAVSRYHFLDESFHTTMSQTISKDLYKDFGTPTPYERFVVNLMIYLVQRASFSGLSAVFPHRYIPDDKSLMVFIHGLLQSPLFGMSEKDAMYWMDQCFCKEHEGFHQAVENHQRILGNYRSFFQNFDFLWPVNRDMQIMASGRSIQKSIQANTKTLAKTFK